MFNKIIRKGSFDAGHRVMFQRFKCSHLHGHRYDYALEFAYKESLSLGYAIDFSELKRIGCAWVDENLDHTFIVNPLDHHVIEMAEKIGSRIYKMHLVDAQGSCNPTVENIAKEVFFAIRYLLETENLRLNRVEIYETAQCIGICEGLAEDELETLQSNTGWIQSLKEFKSARGSLEYDSRKT